MIRRINQNLMKKFKITRVNKSKMNVTNLEINIFEAKIKLPIFLAKDHVMES